MAIQENRNGEKDVQVRYEEILEQIRREAEGLSDDNETIYPNTEKAYNLLYQEQNRLMEELSRLEQQIHESADNPYYWNLGTGPRSLFRRFVRLMNKCIIQPMSDRQNRYNHQVEKGLEKILKGMEGQQTMLLNLDGRLRAQQEELIRLRKQTAQPAETGEAGAPAGGRAGTIRTEKKDGEK